MKAFQKYFKTVYKPVQALPDGSIACLPQRCFQWRKLAGDFWDWCKEQDAVIWDWIERNCTAPYNFNAALEAALQLGSPLI